jgi:hypothetical protein
MAKGKYKSPPKYPELQGDVLKNKAKDFMLTVPPTAVGGNFDQKRNIAYFGKEAIDKKEPQ